MVPRPLLIFSVLAAASAFCSCLLTPVLYIRSRFPFYRFAALSLPAAVLPLLAAAIQTHALIAAHGLQAAPSPLCRYLALTKEVLLIQSFPSPAFAVGRKPPPLGRRAQDLLIVPALPACSSPPAP